MNHQPQFPTKEQIEEIRTQQQLVRGGLPRPQYVSPLATLKVIDGAGSWFHRLPPSQPHRAPVPAQKTTSYIYDFIGTGMQLSEWTPAKDEPIVSTDIEDGVYLTDPDIRHKVADRGNEPFSHLQGLQYIWLAFRWPGYNYIIAHRILLEGRAMNRGDIVTEAVAVILKYLTSLTRVPTRSRFPLVEEHRNHGVRVSDVLLLALVPKHDARRRIFWVPSLRIKRPRERV